MANLCDFSMMVKGKRENIEKFYNALVQNGNVWMGRGAEAEIEYDDDSCSAIIDGCCKWSIEAALVLNAQEMEHQRLTGEGNWDIHRHDGVDRYMTIYEACEEYHVNMEVYSSEPGCCFSEHYKFENGKITKEVVKYYETYVADYENKAEAEEDLDMTFSDEEWGNPDEPCDEDYITSGGFAEWAFDLLDVTE